eukprot:6139561-Alexandrium_andersonii.AAC.1
MPPAENAMPQCAPGEEQACLAALGPVRTRQLEALGQQLSASPGHPSASTLRITAGKSGSAPCCDVPASL